MSVKIGLPKQEVRPTFNTLRVLVGSLGMCQLEKYWDEWVTGRGTVNFRSIGTAGLILGAKRGSAVPILLKSMNNETLGSGRISTSVF